MRQAGPSEAPLRLRAEDAEDLAVISACLQDALVTVRDLAYDPAGRSFLLVANRFRWEGCSPGRPKRDGAFERTMCGIAFDDVNSVAYRGFRRSEEDRILLLLAICAGPGEASELVDLEFAAGATIRLAVAAIRCRARDFGQPWRTAWQPGHRLDEAP